MGKPIKASIDMGALLDAYRAGHASFKKSDKNGKWYVYIDIWLNDTHDRFGNDVSIQLKKAKDAPQDEKKVYIGNGKRNGNSGAVNGQSGQSSDSGTTAGTGTGQTPPGWNNPDDDGLPF